MDELERRILALEFQAQNDRDLSEWRYSDHSRRLRELEANPVTTATLIKLLVAVCLPIGVWIITGDVRKALVALRMMGG